MKRVDNGTQASGNLFTDGNPGTGLLGTIVDASVLNAIQEEIVNVVLDPDSGISVLSQDNSNQAQLVAAIRGIIAAETSGLGGGGSGTGTEVKKTEGLVASDVSTTSTSPVAATTLAYTPIAPANDRYIDFHLDWSLQNSSAVQGQAIAALQKFDGSSWSTMKTIYNQLSLPQGQVLVNTAKATLGADATTSNTSNTASGLQINYTSIGAANKRVVKVGLRHEAGDTNGGGIFAVLILQYFNGSSWVDLQQFENGQLAGGAGSQRSQQFYSVEVEHLVSNAAPQYRIVHRVDAFDSGDSSTLLANSWIEVSEYQALTITENRAAQTFTLLDTATIASPQYRILHSVSAGSTSVIRAGSLIRVREIN
jgi:hypothetical protein